MSKWSCRCGHGMSNSEYSDAGHIVVRELEVDALFDAVVAQAALGSVKEDDPRWKDLNRADAEVCRLQEHLYECPACGRLMWFRGESDMASSFVPEDRKPPGQRERIAAGGTIGRERRAAEFARLTAGGRTAQGRRTAVFALLALAVGLAVWRFLSQ